MSDTLTTEVLAELNRLDRSATPMSWLSLLQDQWVELRNPETGAKYSMIEFAEGHEVEQDLWWMMRTHLPALIAEARAAKVLREEVRAWRNAKDDQTIELHSGPYGCTPPTKQTEREFDAVRVAMAATDSAGALGGGA